MSSWLVCLGSVSLMALLLTRLHVESDRTFLPDRHTASKWSNGKHAIEPIDDAWARQEDSVQDR